MKEKKERLDYHVGFTDGMKVLLWPCKDNITVSEEVVLKIQGLRMDLLIIKKKKNLSMPQSICRIFKTYNIVEYKSPADDLTIDTFSKVLAYGYLYKSSGTSINSIKFDEMTVTIYRHSYPRKLFRELTELGITISKADKGIYHITGAALFPVQILVGKEIAMEEYAMLRILTPNVCPEDVKYFNKIAIKERDETYQEYIDRIYRISETANHDLYARLEKENGIMFEVLMDICKDTINEKLIAAEAKGEARGVARGEAKGAIKLYKDELHLTPSEIVTKIMKRYHLDQNVAEEYVKQTLGLEKV